VLQANQEKSLQQISDGIKDLQQRLRLGIEVGYAQRQQDHFTTDDVRFLQQKLQALSLSENILKKQQAILGSLTFESRPVRHAQIPVAHEKTFKWALRTVQDPKLGLSIGAWLKDGNGIFWVSGKPGSGKSTIMKYIADSEITSRLITEWAQPDRAAIISHYFWIAGTSLQKSQLGLLRTLLYDIFRQCPDIMEKTCVERWNHPESATTWSLMELHEALQAVVARDHASLRLCFFIDGLDEYSGDHEDRSRLCRTLKGLAASGNVKLCLSSRPWNVFEEEFGMGYPKLYMQDLTRDDIHSYALSRLAEHARWATVSAKHSQGQWLVSEIAAKSNGVFLWVFLVTKLLREGLTNRDTFADLRRRLESFPSELEPFFKAMLEAVEPFYHSHMSTALQIANASKQGQSNFLVYSFHFQEYEDVNYAINHPIRTLDDDEIEEIQSNTSWHLDSRTRGLLEVHKDGTVHFIHRTARDFLNTQEMHDFLIAKVDRRLNFHPILSILKAHIAMIKISFFRNRITRRVFGEFDEIMPSSFVELGATTCLSSGGFPPPLALTSNSLGYASELESQMSGDIRHHALLDELDRSLLLILSRSSCTLNFNYWSNREQALLREQLIRLQLFDYLLSKLNSEPNFLANIGTPPVHLFLAIDADENMNIQIQRGRGTDVLACLLENRGIDPNKEVESQDISIWNQLLANLCRWWSTNRKSATQILSFLLNEGILKLFLKAGADPNTLVFAPNPCSLGTCVDRAASVVYLELCFDVLERSPRIQALYLDVLSDFVQLTAEEVLKTAVDEFCMIVSNKDREDLHCNLHLLAKVTNVLRLELDARPGTAESLQTLDELRQRVFQLDSYAPGNILKAAKKRKRKQESGLGRKRKNHGGL
jgi:hypothetical protein